MDMGCVAFNAFFSNTDDTVNPLYNDIRYNKKNRYNVNSVCKKISGACIISFTVPCYPLGKHTF